MRVFVAAAALVLVSCGDDPLLPGPPPTPSSVELFLSSDTASAGSTGLSCDVTVSWQPCPDEDFLMYVLYRSEEPGVAGGGEGVEGVAGISARDSVSLEDAGLLWDHEYHYALLTLDTEQQSAWGPEDSIGTPDLGPTPSALRHDSTWGDMLSLSWTRCPDEDFEGYDLFRSQTPGISDDPDQAEQIRSFSDPSDTCTVDSTFAWGASYYALRTTNDRHFSSWSDELELVTEMPDYPWTVVTEVDLGGFPEEVVLSPAGTEVFLTEGVYSRVIRYSLPSGHIESMSVPMMPSALCMTPDGSLVVVASDISGTLTVYTEEYLWPLGSMDIGGSPSCLASPPSGDLVYCGCSRSGRVYGVKPSIPEVEGQVDVGPGPAGMTSDIPGGKLFVSCRLDDAVNLVALPELTPLASVGVGDAPGPLALSSDGSRLYVCCQADGTVWVLSNPGLAVEHVIDGLGLPTGLCETPDGELLYVSDSEGGEVAIYRTGSWQRELDIDVGADARGLDVTPDGRTVVVGGGSTGRLLLIGVQPERTEGDRR